MGKSFSVGKTELQAMKSSNIADMSEGGDNEEVYDNLYETLLFSGRKRKKYPILWKVLFDNYGDVVIRSNEIKEFREELNKFLGKANIYTNKRNRLVKLYYWLNPFEPIQLTKQEVSVVKKIIALCKLAEKNKLNLYAFGD